MNIIRKNFILGLILIIIQSSIIRASNEYHNIPNTVTENRKSNETDLTNVLVQEIDTLKGHLIRFTENIAKLVMSNPKIHRRIRRSDEEKLNPNVEHKIENLDSKLMRMNENIRIMKYESEDYETSERFASLETATEKLQKLFDNTIRVTAAQMKDPENFVNNLTASIDSFKHELERVKQTFEVQQENPDALRIEIIDDIKSSDFNTAAINIDKLKGELQNNIDFIIYKVYNNHIGNFEMIFRFAKTLNLNKTLAVYKALKYEMEKNDHMDHLKILQIIVHLENVQNALNNNGLKSKLLDEAVHFKDQLYQLVEKTLEEALLNAMKSKKFDNVFKILNNIRLKYFKLFKNLIKEAVQDLINETGVQNLINFFALNKLNPSLNVWIYSTIFNVFKENNNLDQTGVVALAFALKNVIKDERLDHKSKTEANNVRSALPESVNNLAFSEKVCIKNVDRSEYLYAASDDYHYAPGIRNVFTYMSKEIVTQGYWTIEPNNGAYYINNTEHKEYLYANDEHDSTTRRVLTTKMDNIERKELADWVFEPNGDDVYIKNSFGEYMFASEDTYNNDLRRYAYTQFSKDKINKGSLVNASLWNVVRCSWNIKI